MQSGVFFPMTFPTTEKTRTFSTSSFTNFTFFRENSRVGVPYFPLPIGSMYVIFTYMNSWVLW